MTRKKYVGNSRRYRRPTGKVRGTNPDTEQSRQPNGTNEILEYCGFTDGSERASLLREFGDGNHHQGVEVVKAIYPVARGLGLEGNFLKTPQKIRDAFVGIAESYSILPIGGQTSLVLKEDLDSILFNIGSRPLNSKAGPLFMSNLGYNSEEFNGVVMYNK